MGLVPYPARLRLPVALHSPGCSHCHCHASGKVCAPRPGPRSPPPVPFDLLATSLQPPSLTTTASICRGEILIHSLIVPHTITVWALAFSDWLTWSSRARVIFHATPSPLPRSAALYYEVMIYTGPVIDSMLAGSRAAVALAFAKCLALAVAATILLIASGFWVRALCVDPVYLWFTFVMSDVVAHFRVTL